MAIEFIHKNDRGHALAEKSERSKYWIVEETRRVGDVYVWQKWCGGWSAKNPEATACILEAHHAGKCVPPGDTRA